MRYSILHATGLCALAALCAAAVSPITSGYGADGPYVGDAITTYSVVNPAAIGVTLKPVRVYVASSAPAGKRPVLAIAHAYGGDQYLTALSGYLPTLYPDLVRFAVGQGWSVVFVPYPATGVNDHQRYDALWQGLVAAVDDPTAGARIDTSRLGIFGHSFGGGAVPWLAWQATVTAGWGGNGAFAMSCAPWYVYRMTPARMAQLPTSMDVLLQVYDQDDTNDHTMAINLYRSLPQPAARKDYVLVSGGSGPAADHVTPMSGGNGVLNDLDWHGVMRLVAALADHAWNGVDAGRDTALGHGSTAQTAMPSPTSLTSRWDGPVADQPSPLQFPWSSRDTWQPPPTISLHLGSDTATAGAAVALSADAAGVDGATIDSVAFSAAAVTIASDTSAPYATTWTAAGNGPVTVTATAMDDDGRTTDASASMTVTAGSGGTGSGGGTGGGGSSGCGVGGAGVLVALAALTGLALLGRPRS